MKNILFTIIFTLISVISFAQNDANRLKNYNLEKKVALQSYDPVSYFKDKPKKGNSAISSVYHGITYNFATQANKDQFQKKPSNYEPQYGGWCAYAMGNSGEKVEVDPQTYKIIDGKLYLYYNAYFNNTLKSWNKDEINLTAKADVNWKKFIQ
jgi:YHS domain-containing protein